MFKTIIYTKNKRNPIVTDDVSFIFLTDCSKYLSHLNVYKPIDAIITIGDIDTASLSNTSFEIRKKWVHFDFYDEQLCIQATKQTYMLNLKPDREREKLFSVFTCAYKTSKTQVERLYKSLCTQTCTNWDWWILDDTPYNTESYFEKIKDPRVTVLKNITNHGNIGFNKHMIAMCCDGDYLVEIDHDDEIAPDCLELIGKAFEQYPDAVFVYSDCAEMIGEHMVVHYDGDFSFGQGYYETREIFDGWIYPIAITTPSINCKSIRGIYAQPNHVRCWKKDFYHQIGGHNITLPVCDDMELMVRTFLKGKMIHINKVLYIQHEEGGNREDGTGSNTQSKRYQEIQDLNWLLYDKYDQQIHDRIIELCGNDQIWNGEYSELMKDIPREELIDLGYQYNPNIDE